MLELLGNLLTNAGKWLLDQLQLAQAAQAAAQLAIQAAQEAENAAKAALQAAEQAVRMLVGLTMHRTCAVVMLRMAAVLSIGPGWHAGRGSQVFGVPDWRLFSELAVQGVKAH